MAKEVERKFLVKGDAWRALAEGTAYRQGYLNSAKERTVRIRTADDKAYLTIKGLTVGATRAEYEYEIPFEDGQAVLDTLAEKPLIEKRRYRIPADGLTWEIDEFLGDNAGLIVAELELRSEDQAFARPAWLGDEVTGDPRYYNANLVRNPFARWRSLATPRSDSKVAASDAAGMYSGSDVFAGNAAISVAEAEKIVPRAEFRVFGHGIIDIVQERMWEAGAVLWKIRKMPAETYVLSARSDAAIVKVREGLLDVKARVGETPEGFEIFQPRGKFPFPVKRSDLGTVLSHLGVEMGGGRESCTLEEFEEMVRRHPDLLPVTVEKKRYGFSVNGIICEYARVWFNGALLESASSESEYHDGLRSTVAALGLNGMPNTSYLKAAKRVVGMT